MASLQDKYNLRLNKKKSEILTAEKVEHIEEIRCIRMVKYLGVKVSIDAKLQRKTAREQKYRNLNSLKWKLKDA